MEQQRLIVKLDTGNIDYSNYENQEITVKNSIGEHIGKGKVKGDTIEIELWDDKDMLEASKTIREWNNFHLSIGVRLNQ